MARLRSTEDTPVDVTKERRTELRRMFVNHEKKVYKRFVQVTRENILDIAEYINVNRSSTDALFVVVDKEGSPALAKPGHSYEPQILAQVGDYLTDTGQVVGDWERRDWTPSDEQDA